MTRCLVRLHCDKSAALQVGYETCQDILNYLGHLGGAQALQSQTNHGRSTCPGDRQDCMKVCVQGHYDSILLQRECQYVLIGGLTQSDFPEVRALMSETAQQGRSVSRNSLIQDKAHG